jgi:hypothetical protein
MLVEPATPTSGAATPPKPYRTVPSTDDAVPAICGYSASARVVAGGEEIDTPPASRNSDTMTTHNGIGVRPAVSSPAAPTPATTTPTARVPATLHRSALRPLSHPNSAKPAEFSPRADDRGDRPGHGEPAVEADQLPTGVDVAARCLGDDDADTAGEALYEPGNDQQLHGGAERA